MNEEVLNIIISRELDELADKIGVNVESSLFVHGEYDWVISITAENIKQVKKFCEIFYKLYNEHIEKINILENLFTIKKQQILNPDAQELKQFI